MVIHQFEEFSGVVFIKLRRANRIVFLAVGMSLVKVLSILVWAINCGEIWEREQSLL